jgi:hypothetical protein
VPHEAGGLRQVDRHAVTACEHGSRPGVLEQVVKERYRPGVPGELRHGPDFPDRRPRRQNINPQALRAGTLDGSRRRSGAKSRHGEELQQGRLDRFQERHRGCQLQGLAARQVDVLRAGRHGDRAQLVEQGHEGQGADQHEAALEEPPVVELDQEPRGVLVDNLHPECAQLPHLALCPDGCLDALLHHLPGRLVALLAHEVFDFLCSHGLVAAVPVALTGAGAQRQGARGARQQLERRADTLFHLRILGVEVQFQAAVERGRGHLRARRSRPKCSDYPVKSKIAG